MHTQQNESPPASVLDDYLTRDQLARELRVTPRTLTNWKWNRKGPESVLIAGRVHYKRADVIAWLESLKDQAGAK